MKELLEYRSHLIEHLVAAAEEFRAQCRAVKDPFAPIEEGGWNAHQVAAHTRDVDAMVYGLRARRTAIEDNPEFESFDADAHSASHYNANEPLEVILNGLVDSVESLAAMLRGLSGETWARESRHATLGSGFTLQTWVERNLAHIEEHTATLKRTAG
jgi:hypothetical protein